MKDCEKKWQPNGKESVIAKLMGFEELRRPQQTIHEKPRLLSENYVLKAASVGIRPGSLILNGSSCSKRNGIVSGENGVSGVEISKIKNYNVLDKAKKGIRSPKPGGASLSNSSSRASREDRGSCGRKRQCCVSGQVLRYLQKVEHDMPVGHLGEVGFDDKKKSNRLYCTACNRTMKGIFRQEQRRSKFREVPKPGNMGDNYMVKEVEKLVPSLRCVNVNKNDSHDPHLLLDQSSFTSESKKQNPERYIKEEVQEVRVSRRHQTLDEMLVLAYKKSMSRNLNMGLDRNGVYSPSSLQSRSSGSSSSSDFSSIDVWEDDVLKRSPFSQFEEKETHSSGCSLKHRESTARDDKSKDQTVAQKDMLEACDQFETSLCVDDTMSVSSKMSEFSSSYVSCYGSVYSNPDAYDQDVHDKMDNCSENDSGSEIDLSQRNSKSLVSDLAAQSNNNVTNASPEAFNEEVCSKINGEPQSKPCPGILSAEERHSSYVLEAHSEEASLNDYFEEDSAYSNLSRVGRPEFLGNLKRTNEHSPDSVLELCNIENSSNFECFDDIGLRLQLQALNMELEETYSEGSAMAVSDDEDSDEKLVNPCHDGRKIKRWLGGDQSRYFSYLVDVLEEAGFYGNKSLTDTKTWYSLELPICSSVFDTLEKKYGKQTSWDKSERRLLFDRINLGLTCTVNPFLNLPTSVRRRFCSSLRLDEVEDKLWTMLISPEKETSKDLPEKALEKWLELEEGIDIICTEMEISLFDNLVMELASSWN